MATGGTIPVKVDVEISARPARHHYLNPGDSITVTAAVTHPDALRNQLAALRSERDHARNAQLTISYDLRNRTTQRDAALAAQDAAVHDLEQATLTARGARDQRDRARHELDLLKIAHEEAVKAADEWRRQILPLSGQLAAAQGIGRMQTDRNRRAGEVIRDRLLAGRTKTETLELVAAILGGRS